MEAGNPPRLSEREGRKFAFTLSIAFLVLAGIAHYRAREVAAFALGAVGAVLAILGSVLPGRLAGLRRAWMTLALQISKVTTPVVLGVVYFVVITPIGLLRRLFGVRSLRHKTEHDSYWHPVAPRADRDSAMNRQF